MKSSSRFHSRAARGGFTLIEVMTVVTIVAMLAALSFGGFRLAQTRSRTSDTMSRIRAIEMNLERYFGDNGEYPEQASRESNVSIGSQAWNAAGAIMLYQAVSGDGDDGIKGGAVASTGEMGSSGKVYWEEAVAPTEEDIEKGKKMPYVGSDGSGVYYLVDAWHHPFEYTKALKNKSKKVINAEEMYSSGDYEIWSYGRLEKPLHDPESQKLWIASWSRQ